MKKILTIILIVLLLFCGVSACADNPNDSNDGGGNGGGAPTVTAENILVSYFSCTGNTQTVAEKIAAASEATNYRIIPQDPYTDADLNYNDNDCRANREQNDPDARPAISGSVEDISAYDVIFIGYPIWWGRLPKIIYTFMDAYDLSGKTVVPFCTSGGSGISTSVNEIRQLEPDATVLDGRRFSASVSEENISEWIETLNIKSEEETKMQISIKDARYELLYKLNDSTAAKELMAQLPLTVEVEPFSNNEMTFYPPKRLSTANTPLSGGEIGSLSYYAPWGDVVMFYAPCSPNGSLYEIGKIVSGTENISKLTGTITISATE